MENLHASLWFENLNFGIETTESVLVETEKVEDDLEIVPPSQKKGRKNAKSKSIKVEDKDNKRNWLDNKVEALIALKGEMQPEFTKDAKKQGVDMWLKLHSRLLCVHPNFKKTPKACKSKFSELYKGYKDDKQANIIFGESRHTCKFYDSMDTWYHQNGSVLKHVASVSDMGSAEDDVTEVKVESSKPVTLSTSKQGKVTGKKKYQENALDLISQLVVNTKDMAKSMKEATRFMGKLDKHMEKLIEKL